MMVLWEKSGHRQSHEDSLFVCGSFIHLSPLYSANVVAHGAIANEVM